jgi:hypothetical protein
MQTEFSGTVSMMGFLLRGFKEGGLGGSWLFNFEAIASDCFES